MPFQSALGAADTRFLSAVTTPAAAAAPSPTASAARPALPPTLPPTVAPIAKPPPTTAAYAANRAPPRFSCCCSKPSISFSNAYGDGRLSCGMGRGGRVVASANDARRDFQKKNYRSRRRTKDDERGGRARRWSSARSPLAWPFLRHRNVPIAPRLVRRVDRKETRSKEDTPRPVTLGPHSAPNDFACRVG